MAKFNIESILKKFTDDDGNVDYAKINEELQTQNSNIVAKEIAKNKPDENGIIQKFLSDNEFKSIDDFNAFRKNGATADTEAVKRLESEINDYKTKYETLNSDYSNASNELSTYKNYDMLRKEGLNKDLDYHEYKIKKLDGETFEEKLSTYKESNPDAFNVTPQPPNVVKTTGTKINNKVPTDNKYGFEKILEQKGLLKE